MQHSWLQAIRFNLLPMMRTVALSGLVWAVMASPTSFGAGLPLITKDIALPLGQAASVIFQQPLPNQNYAWGSVYYTMGLQLAARGQLLTAQPLLAQATTLIPDDTEGHLVYAAVLEGLGKLEDAKNQYTQAIALDAFLPDAHYKLGLLLDALGDTEGGKAQLMQAIRLAPREPILHYDLGVMHAKQNNYAAAVIAAKQAVVLDPTFAEALNNYAYALAHLKRYEEALAAINQSLAMKPDSAASLDTRGFTLYGLKRYAQALADYDTALVKNPNMGEIHMHRAQTLQALGRLEEALIAYQLYLALEPNAADKSQIESVIQTLQGQVSQFSLKSQQSLKEGADGFSSSATEASEALSSGSLLRGDHLSTLLHSIKVPSSFGSPNRFGSKPSVPSTLLLPQGAVNKPLTPLAPSFLWPSAKELP